MFNKNDLPYQMGPVELQKYIFNGVDGPKLNLPNIYYLFRQEGFPSYKIGRKHYTVTHLFLEWLDNQALSRTKIDSYNKP